jgi:hypothetical protein
MPEPDSIQRLIWGESNPYDGFSHRRFRVDTQGWNSNHLFLSDTIKRHRPSIVVEVGVWKGGSTLHMAETCRANKLDTQIIAVDTWLGAWDHWLNPEWFSQLLFQNGYPSLYYTFLANVVELGLQQYIVPLPLDSVNASIVLRHKRIQPQVIHIDGGHDYDTVCHDLRQWWPLLIPGGTMIMDDYAKEGGAWPGVTRAVDEFLASTPHLNFEEYQSKCRFVKPI